MGIGDALGKMNMVGLLTGWMTSFVFWLIVMVLVVVAAIVGLWIKRWRKLDKVVLEIIDVGHIVYDKEGKVDIKNSLGKCNFKTTKGGWFANRLMMRGLVDYGNEKMFRTADMTPVLDVSHNDYCEINGKMGIVVLRNPHDTKFLIPIGQFYISPSTRTAMAEIAPVDLRNAAIIAMEQTDAEMTAKWQKIMPYVVLGGLILIILFTTLLNTQYGQHMVDKSAETLKYVSDRIANPAAFPATGAP